MSYGTRAFGSFGAAPTGEDEAPQAAPTPWPHRYINGVDFLRVLRRRRFLIAKTVCLVTALSAAAAFGLTPLYTATATIILESREANVTPAKRVLEALPANQPVVETQIEIVKSRNLARRVVDELALHDDREFTSDPDPLAPSFLFWRAVGFVRSVLAGEVAERRAERLKSVQRDSDAAGTASAFGLQALTWLQPPAAWRELWREELKPRLLDALRDPFDELDVERRIDFAVDRLRERLTAEQEGHSNVITLKVVSSDPKKARKIANRVAGLFLEYHLELKRAATDQAMDWLDGRVADLHKQVLEAERAAATYQHQKGLPSSRGDDPMSSQVDRLGAQLALARSERAESEARHDRLRSMLSVGRGSEEGVKIVSSPLLADLRSQEAALGRRVAELSTMYGAKHSQMINATAELNEVRGRISEEVNRILADLASEASVARAREKQLSGTIAALREQMLKQGTVSVELKDLERDAEARRQLYTAFLGRLREITDQQLLDQPDAAIGSKASEPQQPTFPQPLRIVSVSAIGSLALGVMLAFLAEGIDIRVRTAEQLRRIVNLPTLAMTPQLVGRSGRRPIHHYLLDRPRSAFAEALRNIHLELRLIGMGSAPKMVVVTSALPDEGKTTIALCLAAAAASAGHRTALVDLDLHRPGLRKALHQRSAAPDLVDFLSGAATLEEVVASDERVPNLSTLTVRRAPADPRALIASPGMAKLLEQLREGYGLVVLDAPPILPVRDAKILASLADAVLLVVRWGETREDAVQSAMEILGPARNQVFGAVLNRVCLKQHAKGSFGDAGQYYSKYTRYYAD